MARPKRRRWYWKTDTGYKPVRLSEFRHAPVIKLLTETHCLIDGEYVRCSAIPDHTKRTCVMAELQKAFLMLD